MSLRTAAIAAVALTALAIGAAPASATPTGLSGVVTDAATGDPIAYAQVGVVDGDYNSVGQATTDTTGHWELPDVPAGSYKVSADVWGYQENWAQGKTSFDTADFVAAPGTVDFAMSRGAKLSGTFTKNGAPLDGQVYLEDSTGGFVPNANGYIQGGQYTIGDGFPVRPGTYVVHFLPKHHSQQYAYQSPDLEHATPIKLHAGDNVLNDTLRTPTGVVRGTITDKATGKPVSNVCVSTLANRFGGWPCTDARGQYVITELGTQTLSLYTYDRLARYDMVTTDVQAHDGKTVVENIALTRGSRILARVVDLTTGNALPNACFVAKPIPADSTVWSYGCTNSKGWLRLGGVGPGKYVLSTDTISSPAYGAEWVRSNGLPTGQENQAGVVTLKPGGDVVVSTIKIPPAGSVSGQVVDNVTGEPVAGVCVSAQPVQYGCDPSRVTPDVAVTDADGHYTLSGLAATSWPIEFAPPTGSKYGWQWSGGRTNRLRATLVQVTPDGFAQANASLKVGSTLTGTITQSTGSPASRGIVCLFNSQSGDQASGCGFVTRRGTYKIFGITPQTTRLQFQVVESGAEWYGGSDFASATDVTVAKGRHTLDLHSSF